MTTNYVITAVQAADEDEAARRLSRVYALLLGLAEKRRSADVDNVPEAQSTTATKCAGPQGADAAGS